MVASFRRTALVASVVFAAACADLSFVEVEEPPRPSPPWMGFSLYFEPSVGAGRPTSSSASFSSWGPQAPEVTLNGDIHLPPVREPDDGHHYHAIHDTLAADAPAEIRSLSFTPPSAPDAPPITVPLPAMRRVGGAVVCPDSAGFVTLGVMVDGVTGDTSLYWSVYVVASPESEEVQHRATWTGTGTPVVMLPAAALPAGDTLLAHLHVSAWQSITVQDSVRLSTNTSLSERYDIVMDPAGPC